MKTTPTRHIDAHRTGAPDLVKDLPWRVAHECAQRLPTPLGVEHLPLAEAAGRVLAESIRAQVALPGCDVSAMDGYAVAGEPPWHVIGRVLAGAGAWPEPLLAGTAVEIMTGAPVPGGARAVVPYERCLRDGDEVTAAADTRTHIRAAGEDARPGEELVPAGRLVTAAALGTAAQAGLDVLAVYRRPLVHLLVTGDEVVRAGVPGPGRVRDALGPAMAALLRSACTLTQRYLPDGGDLLLDAVRGATDADVVVVSGGSSVGAADHLHRVLETLGARWHVDGIRCRPGHPQALAQTADGRWVVGLPGNPFAGLVAATTLLQPVVAALGGLSPRAPLVLPVTGRARPYDDGVRLVPTRIDGYRGEIIPAASPASLRAAASADALAVIEPGWTTGAPAELLPLS